MGARPLMWFAQRVIPTLLPAALLLLAAGCISPQPLNDVVIHTWGSRLECTQVDTSYTRTLRFASFVQGSTLPKSSVLAEAKARFSRELDDRVSWSETDILGGGVGATWMAADLVSVAITLAGVGLGADATFVLPAATYLTVGYAVQQHTSAVLQRRVVDRPSLSMFAGVIARDEDLMPFGWYGSTEPCGVPSFYLCEAGPEPLFMDYRSAGLRTPAMTRLPSGMYARVVLEVGYGWPFGLPGGVQSESGGAGRGRA